MASEIWPAEPLLPAYPDKSNYSNIARSNNLSFKTEYGPSKSRRRSSVMIKDVKMQMMLTTAQVATLNDFYNNNVSTTDPFDWIDHITGNAVVYRFKKPPSITVFAPGYWLAKLELEITPYIATSLNNFRTTSGGDIRVDSLGNNRITG